MIYKWQGRSYGVSAQVAGEHIETLLDEHGTVTPPLLLADAKSKTSPIHKAFDWNDASAAYAFRLAQARQFLNHLVAVVTTDDGKSREVRAFVNLIDDDEQQGYIDVNVVLGNADLRGQWINVFHRRITALRREFADVKELAGVFEAIDQSLKDMDPVPA